MTLHELNTLPKDQLAEVLKKCCGSEAWVQKMLPFIPADDMIELFEDAEEQWWKCSEADWKEAFYHNRKVGERLMARNQVSTDQWMEEDENISDVNEAELQELIGLNLEYEKKFGYPFVIDNAGNTISGIKTAILTRLQNNPEVEIEIAADEQSKITKARIERLLEK